MISGNQSKGIAGVGQGKKENLRWADEYANFLYGKLRTLQITLLKGGGWGIGL